MKKIVILHWRQSSDKTHIDWPQNTRHWLGWLKDESIKLWFEAYNPLIPRDWEVRYSIWKETIENLDKKINIDENTILVWTSAWWAFWIRWLSENNKSIDKLILVAPARYSSEDNKIEQKSDFYSFDIDKNITNRILNGTTIFISNDEERHIRASKEYADLLNANLVEIPWRWHFTIKANPINNKIPEVLDVIFSDDITKKAKYMIESIWYITLASCDNNIPWNSPVYTAYDNEYNFYFASWLENKHSKNIVNNENTFGVIYDSTCPEWTWFWVYLQWKTSIISKKWIELTKALKLLYGRKNKTPRNANEFLWNYPRRVFKFTPNKIWVNSDGDIWWNFIDTRIDITKGILSN